MRILVGERKLEDVFVASIEVFFHTVVILDESCSTGDHMTHDEVGLEVEEEVCFAFRCRIGEDAGCFLEGSC